MNIEEIKKDLNLIKAYNEKQRIFGEELRKTLGGKWTYIEFQKERIKQSWAGDYEKIVKKYEKLFNNNSVWINDFECSPLEDFLKITVALMENEL